MSGRIQDTLALESIDDIKSIFLLHLTKMNLKTVKITLMPLMLSRLVSVSDLRHVLSDPSMIR
jgi:hypothetical protein